MLATGFLLSGPLVYFAQELYRLYDRSDALRELYDSQRQYEVLLRDARDERDQLKKQQVELVHQNAALQTLSAFASVASTRGEPDRDRQS